MILGSSKRRRSYIKEVVVAGIMAAISLGVMMLTYVAAEAYLNPMIVRSDCCCVHIRMGDWDER